MKLGIIYFYNLPGVGINLKNHVAFHMKYMINETKDMMGLKWISTLDYLLNRRGSIASSGKLVNK